MLRNIAKRLCFLVFFAAPAVVAGDSGKEIFTVQKCVKCHSVDSQDVATTSKKDPSEISDLSNVGAARERAFLVAYIKREETLDGKKHKYKFKGTEQELATLVDWLAALKNE